MSNPTIIKLKDFESHFSNGSANEVRFYNEVLSDIVTTCKATDSIDDPSDESCIKIYSDMETMMASTMNPEDSADYYHDENDGFIYHANVISDAGHFTFDVMFKS